MTQEKNLEQVKETKNGLNVTFQVAGKDVTLTEEIVTNHLAKGNGKVTRSDIIQFTSLCLYNELNPFLQEAYLVKYSNDAPAQMVVSKEAFMKRADINPEYGGYTAGIIVKTGDKLEELEGCFFDAAQSQLVGGWAKVVRKDRDREIVMKVSMHEYNKNMSLWKEKPATMIRKVALVQALREAFPALGSMYTQEEVDVQDATYEEVKTSQIKAQASPVSLKDAEGTIPTNEYIEDESSDKNASPKKKDAKEVKGKSKSVDNALGF